MKKIAFILFVFVPIFLLGQNLTKQNLVEIAVIGFPGQPEISDTLGKRIYTFSNENARLAVVVTNYTPKNEFQLKEGELNQFYDGTIQGVIKSIQGKLINKKEVNIDGLVGTEIEFTIPSRPNYPNLGFQRILYTNKGVFAISYLTTSEKRSFIEKEKQQYFNSFQFTIAKEKIVQFTTAKGDPAYDISFVFGQILGYLFIAGLFFILIRYFIRRTKR